MYLIRNSIDGPNPAETDTMIFQFARNKVLKGNNPAFENLKKLIFFFNRLLKMCFGK